MKKQRIYLLMVAAMICISLCGCSRINRQEVAVINTVADEAVELFYEGSCLISKVSLILNEEIIDFEVNDTGIVVYFDNDIVFRNSTEVGIQKQNSKFSSSNTLEFNELDSDKVKQFIGIIFHSSDAFSEEELQLIDDIYESYANNENFETVFNDGTLAMTLKNEDGKKRLTVQYSSMKDIGEW